jgi:hypothetical protein
VGDLLLEETNLVVATYLTRDEVRMTQAHGGRKFFPLICHEISPSSAHHAVNGSSVSRGSRCFSICVDSIRTLPTLQQPKIMRRTIWRYACISRPWIKEKLIEEKVSRMAASRIKNSSLSEN